MTHVDTDPTPAHGTVRTVEGATDPEWTMEWQWVDIEGIRYHVTAVAEIPGKGSAAHDARVARRFRSIGDVIDS